VVTMPSSTFDALGPLLVASAAAAALLAAPSGPLIIGHRGASGYRPEHTLEGYRLAAEMGADYLEPDLVATRDGVLVARHENEIGATTDAADKFPDRRRTKAIDGAAVTGWFTEDFTLAEVRTLRARERLPFRSHAYDGRFGVPTFDEIIELAAELGRELGRPIGVYPETKHPTYFREIGLALEPRLLVTLARRGWNRSPAPVFIQSFEPSSLREIRAHTQLPLIQLIDEEGGPWDRRSAAAFRSFADMLTDPGLREIRSYADGIGPNRRLVVPGAPDGTIRRPTDLVERAHAAGLLVHVWTLRSDAAFLSQSYAGRPEAEYEQLRRLRVDGVFTDFPDVAFRVFGRAAER
jgi:glycerophosphoryl diester phosphodiesterase